MQLWRYAKIRRHGGVKMVDAIMKALAELVVAAIVVYFIGAFTAWALDPADWSPEGRFASIFLLVGLFVFNVMLEAAIRADKRDAEGKSGATPATAATAQSET